MTGKEIEMEVAAHMIGDLLHKITGLKRVMRTLENDFKETYGFDAIEFLIDQNRTKSDHMLGCREQQREDRPICCE